MIQWIIRKLISMMGRVYVFLDRFLTHEDGLSGDGQATTMQVHRGEVWMGR